MRTPLAIVTVVLFDFLGCGTGDEIVDESPTEADADLSDTVFAIRVLRGVDRASAFSPGEARTLKNNHGVRWTGVYIGGPCSAGSGWSRSSVEAIHSATGWQFMPIFVGQQSPAICNDHDLRFARGQSDGRAAVSRMSAFGWGAHRDIPVTLDVEAGTFSFSPGGTSAYVHGWVNAVRGAGYRGYVYSSPSAINSFASQHLPINAVWVASFFFSGFENVSPSDLSQIGSHFSHHNRAWQYAGDFSVAGVGRVDASTSDLLLAPAPGGTNNPNVHFVDVHSGKCLDVTGGSSADGTNIELFTCNGRASQSFRIVSHGSDVTLVNAGSGKCVDVDHSGTADGTNIQLYHCNGTGAQSFRLGHPSRGIATFVNTNSNKCIDVTGFHTADRTNIELFTCNGGTNQEWRIVAGGAGSALAIADPPTE